MTPCNVREAPLPRRVRERAGCAPGRRRACDVRAQIAVILADAARCCAHAARATRSSGALDVSGAWKSQPCAAASSSMPTTFGGILRHVGAAGARHAPPSRRDLPGWPRSGSSRRWPDGRAACSPRPAPRPSPARSMKPELSPGLGVRNAGRPDSAGSTSMAMRRSASEPISQIASASMSAANATGSAWKLPPDNASRVSAKISGLSETPFASVCKRRGRLAHHVERGTHHLRLAAQAIRVLHAIVAGEMRGADARCPPSARAARAATSIWPRWPRSAWMRGSNGVSEPLRRIGRQRAGDQRGLEACARSRTAPTAHSAVENCVPLSSASPSFGPSTSGVSPRAPARSSAGMRSPPMKASPTPIIAAAMCASGARSPDAPTEPCAGTTRHAHRGQHWLQQLRAFRGRTPEAPRARLASFSAIISRTIRAGIGAPTPAACDSTMLRWSVARSSGAMRTLASLPKPVLMP